MGSQEQGSLCDRRDRIGVSRAAGRMFYTQRDDHTEDSRNSVCSWFQSHLWHVCYKLSGCCGLQSPWPAWKRVTSGLLLLAGNFLLFWYNLTIFLPASKLPDRSSWRIAGYNVEPAADAQLPRPFPSASSGEQPWQKPSTPARMAGTEKTE